MVVRSVLMAAGAGGASLFASADFKSTITLGSIIVAMLVVILFGVFSLRDRRNSGWKDLYEQKAARVDELVEEKEQERIVRHSIKDELASCRSQLEIERAKPNLSGLTSLVEEQRTLWVGATALLKTMQETQQQMLQILQANANSS